MSLEQSLINYCRRPEISHNAHPLMLNWLAFIGCIAKENLTVSDMVNYMGVASTEMMSGKKYNMDYNRLRKLLNAGYSQNQISRILGISQATVRRHVGILKNKELTQPRKTC